MLKVKVPLKVLFDWKNDNENGGWVSHFQNRCPNLLPSTHDGIYLQICSVGVTLKSCKECDEAMVISFTPLRKVGRSQSQRGVKHRVVIDDFQL